MKDRIKYFDNCRAMCVLWIVGVWHLLGYCELTEIINNSFAAAITNGALATFTFISGLFLGRKTNLDTKSIVPFWKKRLVRFYPLFFLSCTSLYLVYIFLGFDYINSGKQYLLTLFGFAPFVGNSPQTIWYISMLILYYFVSPLILCIEKKKFRCLVVLGSYIILIILKICNNAMDIKIITLYPFYFISLLFSKEIRSVIEKGIKWFVCVICLLAFVILNLSCLNLNNNVITAILSSLLFTIVLIVLGKCFSHIVFINILLYIISYSSMVAYLFHRQYYGLMQFLFFRHEGAVPLWFAYIIMFPTIILFSYLGQLLYDKLINITIYKKN